MFYLKAKTSITKMSLQANFLVSNRPLRPDQPLDSIALTRGASAVQDVLTSYLNGRSLVKNVRVPIQLRPR